VGGFPLRRRPESGEQVRTIGRSGAKLGILFGLLSLLELLGCGPPPPPNVLLVSIDTLRADAVGAYGGPVATPTLDRLAREGSLFEQAIAPASQTTPSHATIFTGLEVLHHGALRNGIPLAESAETLAEVFQRRGYATAAFASSFVLDPRFGWTQGFDHYDAEFPRSGETLRSRSGQWRKYEFDGFDRRAAATNSRALPWLESAAEPFFLFVHYFDPHAPYAALPARVTQLPDDFAHAAASERIEALKKTLPGLRLEALVLALRNYQAEVLAVDAALGRLLAALEERGLEDRTLVVVTADHGEGLGQHGTLDHAPNIYEEQLRVPLVMRWPERIPAGRRIAQPVGLVDLAPTIAAAAALAFDRRPDGRSLLEAIETRSVTEPRPIFGRRRNYPRPYQGHRGTLFSVRDGDWKLIRATEDPDELYDLAADPTELSNLLATRPDISDRLSALLDETLARHPDQVLEIAPDTEVRRGLEALGYVE
jgi:choline-sulfatase